MIKHYFGAHILDFKSIEQLKKAGGNLIQIFMTFPKNIKTETQIINYLIKLKEYLQTNNIKVVVHSSYLHNLAKNWNEYSWWITQIIIEIKYAYLINAIGLVVHIGNKLELSISEAYNNVYTSLLYIHNKTIEYKSVKILLESSSGQGTELCYKLNDLSHFYKKFSKNEIKSIKDRFKLCIDTCHIFVAGYDLTTIKKIKNYLDKFDELIGLKYIKLIHLNDSKSIIGSRKDRHDNIGKGKIGIIGLRYFYKYFKKLNIPIILETPGNGYLSEIKLLNTG